MNSNKRKTTLPWLLVFLVLSVVARAQEKTPQPLSLAEAKTLALNQNKTIQTARLDMEIAHKKVQETTAIGLPQVNFSANYQHIFKVPEFSFPVSGLGNQPLYPAGNYPSGYTEYKLADDLYAYSFAGPGYPIMEQDNATFDFQVNQLIFSGEYIVGLQAAKVYKTITEQLHKKNQLDVALSVETSYYTALVLAENLAIVKQNVELTQKTYQDLSAMLKEGFVEDTEVDQLELTLKSLNNLEISMQGQLKSVLNMLKYQMGMDLSQPIELTDRIDLAVTGLPALLSNDFQVNDNIEYQMVANQVEVQKLNLRREQSSFLPTVAAFYQHQEKLKQPALDFTPKDLLGVSLTLPLFTSTQRLAKVKQASLELEKTKLSQSQLADGLALQYESQKLNYETAYNNYINQKQTNEISRKIFDKTVIKLKEGTASSLDLTQVQAQYLSSTGNYYTAMLNLLNAKAELNRLTSQQ
ncbi:MAG: TolC family protein [Breznakibacter sp.]